MATATIPVNYWPQTATAKAFWGQQELPPYKQLLEATAAWLEPKPGERWLDLGCGGGQLTKALWLASRGRVAEIAALDCAAVNARAYAKLRLDLWPPPGDCIRFIAADFSAGLPFAKGSQFDGVVSGLAIQYAESYSHNKGCWTSEAYDRVLAEVHRVLKPGGRFVFSVNVANPRWARLALASVPGVFFSRHPLRFLQKAWAMYSFGGWLKREAQKGRFHYLPRPVIADKLTAAGFTAIERQRSFAGQAYIFRCRKPA